MSASLVAQSATGVDLEAALRTADATFGLEGAVSMLYTLARFTFGRVETGHVHGPDGRRIPSEGVFEARIFTPALELRWVAGETGGRAAVLHEESDRMLGDPWIARPVAGALASSLAVSYLLWGWPIGSADGLVDGWCRLGEARVGALAVPHPPVPGRLRIGAKEYVGVDPVHGNARVIAERLLRIEPVDAEGAQADG